MGFFSKFFPSSSSNDSSPKSADHWIQEKELMHAQSVEEDRRQIEACKLKKNKEQFELERQLLIDAEYFEQNKNLIETIKNKIAEYSERLERIHAKIYKLPSDNLLKFEYGDYLVNKFDNNYVFSGARKITINIDRESTVLVVLIEYYYIIKDNHPNLRRDNEEDSKIGAKLSKGKAGMHKQNMSYKLYQITEQDISKWVKWLTRN